MEQTYISRGLEEMKNTWIDRGTLPSSAQGQTLLLSFLTLLLFTAPSRGGESQ